MLPKESPLARAQMTHLRIFAGAEHPHAAQAPETIAFAEMNPKNVRSAITMTDIAPEETAAAPAGRPRPGASRPRPAFDALASDGGAPGGRSAPTSEGRRPGSRLRHRQAQERHRQGLAEAGLGQDHHQRPRPGGSTSPARCCA